MKKLISLILVLTFSTSALAGGWNGSGTFTKSHSWVQDQANGIKIRADRHDDNDNDFLNGINDTLTKDGQNSPTTNLPMAGFHHTNVSSATARNQYLTMGQFQDQSGVAYTTTGSSNAYVLSITPAITAYADGERLRIKASFANSGAATINVNGLGAKALTKNGTTALASGDLVSGTIYDIQYDGTQFQVLNINAVAATVTGPSSSVDSEISLFNGTSGNVIKRATGTGYIKVSSGVYQTPSATVPLTDLAAQSASTIVANITGGSASPTAATPASVMALSNALTGYVAGAGTVTGADSILTAIQKLDGNIITNSMIGSGTTQAATSGTAIDFTGIPSGVKRVTVIFSGLSTSGGSNHLVQIGTSGGIQNSGYLGSASGVAGGGTTANFTTGFGLSGDNTAGCLRNGFLTLSLMDSSTNTWVASGTNGRSDITRTDLTGGSKVLSGVLDRVRITTVNGTDTFDAGSINIFYEY